MLMPLMEIGAAEVFWYVTVPVRTSPGCTVVLSRCKGTEMKKPPLPLPQTFAIPAPPQVCGAVQMPQSSVLLQPSPRLPQFFPCAAQVLGVQAAEPHTFAVPPPPHVCGDVQVPQVSVLPQPSLMLSQFLPCATQVVGEQPQTLATPPPPHVLGGTHVPQALLPDAGSPMVPATHPPVSPTQPSHAI